MGSSLRLIFEFSYQLSRTYVVKKHTHTVQITFQVQFVYCTCDDTATLLGEFMKSALENISVPTSDSHFLPGSRDKHFNRLIGAMPRILKAG